MKVFITTFYNVRFLKSNQVPVSTAVWDPKWYHQDQKDDFLFVDKRNIINGFREPKLSPYRLDSHDVCVKCCPYKQSVPECPFLIKYDEYLHTLDFTEIIADLLRLSSAAKGYLKFEGEPEVVLLVYEKLDNPCSERHALKKWFKENGLDLIEWTKDPA